MPEPRPYVTFRSTAFKLALGEKESGPLGADLAGWMADCLADMGWEVGEEIAEEDQGWAISFGRDRDDYDLVVTCLVPEKGRWLAWLEPSIGLFQTLLGGRQRPVSARVAGDIHRILADAGMIDDIRWHDREAFRRGDLEEGAVAPTVISVR